MTVAEWVKMWVKVNENTWTNGYYTIIRETDEVGDYYLCKFKGDLMRPFNGHLIDAMYDCLGHFEN